MKQFNVIAAVALNGVIGDTKTNNMPWCIREDLKYFKQQTLEKTIISGMNTYLSMPTPLPMRRNVVITRHPEKYPDAVYDAAYASFATAYEKERDNFFVVGGGQLYKEAFEWAPDNLYITVVHLEPQGDVKFPLMGAEFLEQTVNVPCVNVAYLQHTISEIKEENGIKFQFALFKRMYK